MIFNICLIVLILLYITSDILMYSQMKKYEDKAEKLEDMIVKNAQFTAELSDRVDGLEDYMKMIKSETENDKHADYWASVMNYNPFIEKEGEK